MKIQFLFLCLFFLKLNGMLPNCDGFIDINHKSDEMINHIASAVIDNYEGKLNTFVNTDIFKYDSIKCNFTRVGDVLHRDIEYLIDIYHNKYVYFPFYTTKLKCNLNSKKTRRYSFGAIIVNITNVAKAEAFFDSEFEEKEVISKNSFIDFEEL